MLADNDDSLHTIIAGNWVKKTSGGYGPSWLLAAPGATLQSVQLKPQIAVSGKYALYAYVPVVDSAATQTHCLINNGTTTKDVIISSNIQAEGQTSGEWVSLGTYSLPKGNTATVTISTKDANGYIVADAVLCVPVK